MFMLHYHLAMCIKHRNKVIDGTISNHLKEIFVKIAPAYNIAFTLIYKNIFMKNKSNSNRRSKAIKTDKLDKKRNDLEYNCQD